ncbi:GPI inositol-deacylase [Eumeta japonica]|uniref:GPI inositol-deacylase n=1 Tax=Eumeta variegata TaxID=151549 RepID=A0A4C2A640_EUMVA|nr:GPI inositol-deacylase [Eumeta japonica]
MSGRQKGIESYEQKKDSRGFFFLYASLMIASISAADMLTREYWPRRITLPDKKDYPQYGLFVYSEGRLTERARKMWFDGIPVLYLPGNSGSHMQGRSLASVALRKAISHPHDFHFDFFTVTEFLWPPSSSIIRLWLPCSTKVLVKTNQTSPNSMGLRRLIMELLATFQLHQQTLVTI